ncbi:MAG: hypothetical protein WC450_10390 [Candidatus Omnitrophota bacterium]|jgi:hypothetical protein
MTEGTVFDNEIIELGDWFPFFDSRVDLQTGEVTFFPSKEGAATFQIRPLTLFYEEIRNKKKKEYKWVSNPKTHAMERRGHDPDQTPEDEQREREDSYDYAITGARNAYWGKGKDNPIFCIAPKIASTNEEKEELRRSRADKIKLMRDPAFSRYFLRVQEMLSNFGAKAKEELEKN